MPEMTPPLARAACLPGRLRFGRLRSTDWLSRPAPSLVSLLLLVGSVTLAGLVGCRGPDVPPGMQQASLTLPQTDGPMVLHIRSDGFEDGKPIPEEYSAYGKGDSPPLNWSGVPPFTRSLVLMVEDPLAGDPKPFVHWLVYNIPAKDDRLPSGVAMTPELDEPRLAVQGKNSSGSIGYFGPKPPKGDPAHHYHFQLFALDRFLSLKPGATRLELLAAMDGHVVGKGQLVGTYRER